MMKRFTYLTILILWGCNFLVEQAAPLTADFYIQNGWLEFASQNYDIAGHHFNKAIEINDSGSVYHCLASIGLGWTDLYKAKENQETSHDGFVQSSGEHFDFAENYLLDRDTSVIVNTDLANLYAGLTFQKAYLAKQKSANGINWGSTNLSLSDTVETLYRKSLECSDSLLRIDAAYVFNFDISVDYNAIYLLRIENNIMLGNFDSAVVEFEQSGLECKQCVDGEKHGEYCNSNIDCYANDIEEGTCVSSVNEDNIIECFCEVANNGGCPFE